MRSARHVIALALCGWLTTAASSGERNAALEALKSSVTQADLKRHVEFLADDTLEGREAGSRGGQAAGHYLGEQFQKHRLAGGGARGAYYQSFGSNYRNLLGVLEGSDPALKQEIVLIGAHYDHVGYGNSQNSYGPTGYIHNGADDNGSGTAALLEMVEAFTSFGSAPPRTLVFALWDGEEKGLLGSKHWVENPTIPLERIKLAINMDMLGRLKDNKLTVYGTRTGAGLRQLVSRHNADRLLLDFDWTEKPDSDHYSFYEKRIPYVMLFTGLHPDYHRPSDDVERLNTVGLEQLARMLTGIVFDAAYAPALPKFRQAATRETSNAMRGVERALPPLPPRLGVQFDSAADQPPRVSRITPDSPAAKANLQVGDTIHRVAGREVRNLADFQRLVQAASSPIKLQIGRATQVSRIDVLVDTPVAPSRWGLTWRSDEAEPGALIVQRVVRGSPAERAGIAVGDRLMSIDGRTFADGAAFREALLAAQGSVVVEREREGRVDPLTVEPLAIVDGQGADQPLGAAAAESVVEPPLAPIR